MNIFSNYNDFLYSIGYFSQYSSFIITCALIFNSPVYLFFYIILLVLTRIFNNLLKDYFKQDRPGNPKKYLYSDKFGKTKYGMPSGHTQLTFFSMMYYYMVSGRFIPWTLLLLIMGVLTIYQRYAFNNHTMYQLVLGAGIGIITAYLSVLIIDKYVPFTNYKLSLPNLYSQGVSFSF